MSFLFAIESSTKSVSVALFQDERLMEEVISPPDQRTHSEKLLPMIHQLLAKFDIHLTQKDAVSVAVGPGSFTSVRVGIATALGLAQGFGCGLYAVSSLKSFAFGRCRQGGLVAPIFKGGRSRIYGALFGLSKKGIKTIIEEGVYKTDEFVSLLKKVEGEIIVIGPGYEIIDPLHKKHLTYLDSLNPQASFVGLLVLAEKPPLLSPNEVKMRYLQEPDFGGK